MYKKSAVIKVKKNTQLLWGRVNGAILAKTPSTASWYPVKSILESWKPAKTDKFEKVSLMS